MILCSRERRMTIKMNFQRCTRQPRSTSKPLANTQSPPLLQCPVGVTRKRHQATLGLGKRDSSSSASITRRCLKNISTTTRRHRSWSMHKHPLHCPQSSPPSWTHPSRRRIEQMKISATGCKRSANFRMRAYQWRPPQSRIVCTCRLPPPCPRHLPHCHLSRSVPWAWIVCNRHRKLSRHVRRLPHRTHRRLSITTTCRSWAK